MLSFILSISIELAISLSVCLLQHNHIIVMRPLPTHLWTLPISILIKSQVLSKILDTLLILD